MNMVDDVLAVFVANVRACRTQRGWSQEALAQKLLDVGVKIGSLGVLRIEKGKQRPYLDQAIGIADCFGLQLQEMFNTLCGQCGGVPPVGFSCNSCGRSA